ncbi:Calcineurin-Hypothetical protein protein [Nesidiocoris tenuis]|uniref:Calcineurin-binding protein cabin-1 MEF2-binding domain-containing protein n=1 Tax=Nesidiocoris tenuis TaxID=355587 RepID=A0ABN7ASR4_9HEMI|nr:Calcineurin-Hypothetical protein protein [Nesidiocoris tenuis]
MIPTKFKPLVSDSSGESSSSSNSPKVTKEALEQGALIKYQEALDYERKGEWNKAEHVLKELLKTEILAQVKGEQSGVKKGLSTMGQLKYCVCLNLGNCYAKQDKLKRSLKQYGKASRLDSTDLNLWYKMGLIALKQPDLHLAASAFQAGLRCSPRHWPCVDNIVSTYYASGDMLSCLYYAHMGILMDSSFLKGWAFSMKILTDSPTMKDQFSLFYPECVFPSVPSDLDLTCSEVEQMYREVDLLREKESARFRKKISKSLVPIEMPELVRLDTWERLIKALLVILELAEQKSHEMTIYRPMILRVKRDCPTPFSIEMEETEAEESDNPESCKDEEDEDYAKSKTNGVMIEKMLSQNQKRRSARVRSTAKREEPGLSAAISSVLPSHLLPIDFKKNIESWSDDSLHTMDLYRIFKEGEDEFNQAREDTIKEENYFGSENEVKDVEEFVEYAESTKECVVDAMKRLVEKLTDKWTLQWPENLGKLYVKIYKAILKYFPDCVVDYEERTTFVQDCSVMLYGELLLKHWLVRGRHLDQPSPLESSWLGGEFCSLNLGRLAHRVNMTDNLEFYARAFWLEALLLYYCGDTEPSIRALEKILSNERLDKINVRVPNLTKHSIINKAVVTKLIKSFRRNKSLASVRDLYSEGCYDDVCAILIESLETDPKEADSEDQAISRLSQYAFLLDSLSKCGKYEDCLLWSEACLFEAINEYRRSNDEERTDLVDVLISVLNGLIACIELEGVSVLRHLSLERRSRLVQSLCGIIIYQLEAPEGTITMPITTVSPWIILHYILKSESEESKVFVSDDDIPPWMQILFIGHDYLGRRSWCCFDEGSLLFHILKIVYPMVQNLPPESKPLIKINQHVEQIFFCLYSHERKIRCRHLVSHNATGTNLGLALTWNRAQQVFLFMKPRLLPAYDSTGKCVVTPDHESLYLKLLECVPPELNASCLVPELKKFLNGQTDSLPDSTKNPYPEDIRDIYYLLAHFYFKNKLWAKTVKYCMLDLCINPDRVDSWACLALARGSQSDTMLNSCETIKSVTEFLNKAASVCRSYNKSLELDPGQSTLWIEKGNFCYSIHAYCSNILKKNQDLSLEMYQMLEDKKATMIEDANQCFLKANQLWYATQGADYPIDERWLHHYMLGKIACKRDDDPSVYINHYLKAADLLHQVGANYPAVINHAAPQLLSVESLEIYYRMHATMLKILEEHEEKQLPQATADLFKSVIGQLESSPFIVQVKTDAKVDKKPTKEESISSLTDDDFLMVTSELEAASAEIAQNENNENSQLKRKLSSEDTICEEPPSKLQILTADPEEAVPCSIKGPPQRISSTSESNEGLKTSETVAAPAVASSDQLATSSCTSSATGGETNKENSSSGSSSSTSSSSSSSSDSSSGSSDSSSSSSSSSSDSSSSSSSSCSNPSKKIKLETENSESAVTDSWIQEQDSMIDKCLAALETCHKRFSEHYKTLYNLAHFYFKSKKRKSVEKVQQLLLGPNGLFGDRKPYNFFNGVWRIPQNEIDRPGSFAAHMSRSVVLLLDVLAEVKDYKMLIDLSIQLKVEPEAEKKYLRDNEREEMSIEAAEHGAQVLRRKLLDYKPDSDEGKDFLLEVYQIYKRINRSGLKDTMYAAILTETFNKFTKESTHTLDSAIRFCAGEIAIQKQVPYSGGSSGSLPPFPTSLPSQIHPTSRILDNVSITPIEVMPPFPLPKRGRPLGPGKKRDPNEPRRPRGRPPGPSQGPRMPNPAQAFNPNSMTSFAQYQKELLRQFKESRDSSMPPTLNTLSLNLPSSVSVSCGSGNISLGQDNSSPAAVLKERPSLSIIPVSVSSGSPAASAGPKSPSTSSQSALLSINKLASKAAKRSQSPLALSMGVTSISGMSPTSIMAKGIQAIAGSTSLLTSTASALSMLPSSVQMHPIPGAAMPNPLQHLTITPTSSRANIPATTAGSSPLNQVLQPYSIAPAVPPSTSSFSSLSQPVPVSSAPSLMTPSVPVTTSSSLHPHPLSLTPTSQVPTSLPLPLTTHSSNRQVATSLAQLIQPPSSGSISISPIPAPLSAPSPLIAAAHQPSKKSSASHKSPGQPKQRLPELPKPAHTSSEYSKSRFGGSLIHSLQSSIPPQQSSNQPTLSLQHKLLAKKLNQSKIKQDSSLTQPLPSSSVGGSANPHTYSTDSKSFLSHPTPKSQSQLPSAVSGPVPKATPAFGSSPTTPMALTNPPKLPSNVMKKLPNSLTIVPSGSASRGPDPLSDMVTSASSAAPKKSFFDEIFDQNVTNAIKSFGSSITITAAKTHKLPYSTSESVPASSASHSSATTEPAPKSRKMPKKKKLSNEVIVLDD